MKRFLLLFAFAVSLSAMAGDSCSFTPYYKYRVSLADKKMSAYKTSHPEEFLSEKAVQRRKRQGIRIDETDLPVSETYLKSISESGVKILCTSKWNNTVLVQCTDTLKMNAVSSLPFVEGVRRVAVYTSPAVVDTTDRRSLIVNDTVVSEYNYGSAQRQIEQINGLALHERGFRGEGMTIAIIDGGFYNADVIPMLDNVRILGTHDFVNPNSDIYAENSHGMMVLSCIGTNKPGKMVGTAPGASFWLLRSEDGDTEQMVEEDYWAAAMEFADSVGADVVNSSLGYTKFDNSADNIEYREQDGITRLISRTASMVASKGMILCNSAGNEGMDAWKRIGCPADARDILTVGAVDRKGVNALFSSLGYSADGRVKPDVATMGVMSTVLDITGRIGRANGTSFSSPILTGMVACLWQAFPDLDAYEIMDLVRRSGDRADYPDNVFGYGIPDFGRAYRLGVTETE